MKRSALIRAVKRTLMVSCLVAAFASAVCNPRPAFAGDQKSTLTVFAAASLADAFDELGKQFEAAHPGVKVEFNFAGSQQLATQVEHGAGADVFASADERWMNYLKRRDLVQGAPSVFVRNRLVVIVPKSNPARIDRLQDLARSGVKLILGAESVPVGAYSREAIRRLARTSGFPSDFGRRVLANLASEEENVRQVVGKVQLGEADAGFVYRSDVTPPVARQVKVLTLPDSCNVLASYPISILKDAPRSDLAADFLKLVFAPEGQAVLKGNGFIPIGAAGE